MEHGVQIMTLISLIDLDDTTPTLIYAEADNVEDKLYNKIQ